MPKQTTVRHNQDIDLTVLRSSYLSPMCSNGMIVCGVMRDNFPQGLQNMRFQLMGAQILTLLFLDTKIERNRQLHRRRSPDSELVQEQVEQQSIRSFDSMHRIPRHSATKTKSCRMLRKTYRSDGLTWPVQSRGPIGAGPK